MSIGPLEILVILVIALLIFGPDKMPELARTVGKGMRELRRLQRMVQSELDGAMTEPASGRPTTEPGTETAGDLPAGEASGNGASGNGASGNGGRAERAGDAGGPDATPDADRDA